MSPRLVVASCLILGASQPVAAAPPRAAPAGARDSAQDAPLAVKALANLFQVVKTFKSDIAAGELGAIHNEDVMLRSVLGLLGGDVKALPPGKPGELQHTLVTLSRQIADLHEAADAFNQTLAESRLALVVATAAQLERFYAKDVLTWAHRLAARAACPMHREVVGKETDLCPKCGMRLDQPLRIPVLFQGGEPALHTVRALVQTPAPLQVGTECQAVLRLRQLTDAPVLPGDLRTVHTQKIHLLIIDGSLTDYHHVHPQPTKVPGEYAFAFTPRKPGPYRAWADLRTTVSGYQEYAMADIPSLATGEPLTDRAVKLRGELEGLRYVLSLDKPKVTAGEPLRAHLRVTKADGRPFKDLEPVMATFAHFVAFNEDGKTVLHIHPKGTKALAATDRGGPELELQIYATEPGFYRLFAQVQIQGQQKFVPFGLTVSAARETGRR